MKYVKTFLEVGVLLLAAAYLVGQLGQGRAGRAAATAAGA